MNREQLIKDKLAKGKNVNYKRIAEKDANSLVKLLSNEKGKLITVEDSIDNFLANPELTIDESFITLKVEETAIKNRIAIINSLKTSTDTNGQ